jgi:hypothetical protein
MARDALQHIDRRRLDRRVAVGVHGNSGLTCAMTNRARPIAACRCSMPSPGIVPAGFEAFLSR